jgi:integrase
MAVLGIEARPRTENSTRRIAEHTMNGLLTWALRFTEDFADDILTAAAEYNRLAPYRERGFRSGRKVPRGGLVARAEALAEKYRREKLPLPGRATENGVELDISHIARLLDTRPAGITISRVPDILLASGLPIIDCAPLTGPVTGRLDGVPWKDTPIGYGETGQLVNVLTAACLIVVAYLSGMRPSEVLNLRRGCVHHDQATGLWTVNGLTFKNERDDAGHRPEGAEREVPWVVVEPVAQAVNVMERLHSSPLLFPSRLLDSARPTREGGALDLQRAGNLVLRLTNWVNAYCADRGRPDVITPDPIQERITLSRFRRTLCWHIYRKPRGLVAAAIQYGHIATTTTLGYAGNAESGFPDDLAFERFLARLDDLSDAKSRLDAGEHVSGPSALVYRERIDSANQQFQGIVLTSGRQAQGLLSSPSLQIYHGRGMTCVPQMGKQLCQQRRTPAVEDSPDLTDCRRGCQCKAYTDTDLIDLQHRATILREVIDDPLIPALRAAREREELQRLTAIIDAHNTTRTTAPQERDGS